MTIFKIYIIQSMFSEGIKVELKDRNITGKSLSNWELISILLMHCQGKSNYIH